MRNLLARDIAPFTKILAKMDIKDSIKAMFGENKEQGEMVSELVWAVIENYHKAENEFLNFLADLQEEKTTKLQIENLSIPEFIELVKELFSEKNFPFFNYAAK